MTGISYQEPTVKISGASISSFSSYGHDDSNSGGDSDDANDLSPALIERRDKDAEKLYRSSGYRSPSTLLPGNFVRFDVKGDLKIQTARVREHSTHNNVYLDIPVKRADELRTEVDCVLNLRRNEPRSCKLRYITS